MVVSQRKPQKNHKGAKFYYVKLKKNSSLCLSLLINDSFLKNNKNRNVAELISETSLWCLLT